MTHQEFVDLIEDLKGGGSQQLKHIYIENAAYCIRKLTSKHSCLEEDAEDLYTDAVLNFREKILSGEIEFLTDIRSYLYATCKNMFLVKLKKKERTVKAFLEINSDRQNSMDENSEEERVNYQDQMQGSVFAALAQIPEKCQQLLRSFYFDKLSLEEIAKRFEFANANVAKVSKARCYKKLVDQVRAAKNKI